MPLKICSSLSQYWLLIDRAGLPPAPQSTRSRVSRSSATWCKVSAATGSTVTTIVGPNADTHVYEPKPGDAAAVASAQIFFVNGLGFEGWMDRLGASRPATRGR